ncbi:MAG: hypothetical protein JOY79_09280 [Acidobacteriaceae bacterium]|nr:hypothetical protein [Acidobacteriaceae bacterium]
MVETHVKILGVLYIVIGALGVAASLVLLGLFGGIAGLSHSGGHPNAAPVIGFIGLSVMLVILAISAPSIVAGVGLLKFQPWARILTLILSALHLFSIPIGTALGVYGLWVLLKRDTEPLFRRGTIQVT